MIKKYEQFVASVNKEPTLEHALSGLATEIGEVAAIFQKHYYKGQKVIISELIKELGDVLFYVVALADLYNISLTTIIDENIKKLTDRHLTTD